MKAAIIAFIVTFAIFAGVFYAIHIASERHAQKIGYVEMKHKGPHKAGVTASK